MSGIHIFHLVFKHPQPIYNLLPEPVVVVGQDDIFLSRMFPANKAEYSIFCEQIAARLPRGLLPSC
jgi:hypothetical protein